jgi:uncharacterized protein (TIGR02594 family)
MPANLDAAPAWLKVAYAEIGERRAAAGSSNPRIDEYNNATTLRGYDDKISWCSSFVNWCLAQSGIEGTRSALARSWIDWGDALVEPVFGCIAVVRRDSVDSWKGHVGFFIEAIDEAVILLGGNQDEQVKLKAYPRTDVLAFRSPGKSPGAH